MVKNLWVVCLSFAFGVSCTTPDDMATRIVVTEQNELGVTAIEVSRFDQERDVFVLRAFNKHVEEVGSVRLRLGEVAELTGDDKTGSELVVAVGNEQHRQVSREQVRFQLAGPFAPPIEHLLKVEKISTALLREASIVVSLAQPTAEDPFNNGGSCNPDLMNTSPVAKQCCSYWGWSGNCLTGECVMVTFTRHVNASNQVVERNKRYGNCKSSTGGSCSGSACYFGPNGFSRPNLVSGSGYPKIWVDASQDCVYQFYGSPQTPVFGDVTGTYPTGRGCCVNGSGPCGPGLIACSSCGGGGSAGEGSFDY